MDLDFLTQGIAQAVSRGSTLKQAMMSFYTAGYKKQDVETAARTYLQQQQGTQPAQQTQQVSTTNPAQAQPNQQPTKKQGFFSRFKKKVKISTYSKVPEGPPKEKIDPKTTSAIKATVSEYKASKPEEQKKGKGLKMFIIFLSIVFGILLLVLLGLIFFGEDMIQFILG